jgi:mRNA interferase RelE/StbE
MEVKYSKQAYKYLMKLHRPKREQIEKAIGEIPKGNIKKLQGFKEDIYRLRVDSYRVIFNQNYDIIKIIKIGSRGDIYDN